MFGFKENAVFNNNRIRGEVSVGVNVCHMVRIKFFAAVNGEGVGIEYVDLAFHEFFADFNDFFNGAFCRSAAAYVRENDRAGFNIAGPVFFNRRFNNFAIWAMMCL